MTEAEWLECADPGPMLEFLRGKANERKLRLFAVACCRRIWTFLEDECDKQAVEVADAFADGQATGEELRAAAEAAWAGLTAPAQAAMEADAAWASTAAIAEVAREATEAAWVEEEPGAKGALAARAERQAQANLLRCIFGNPVRPAAVDPAWLTAGVVELARTIYEGRAFARMPELADALERAGCADVEVLAHCRGPGPHVRGCWVVDLILGKT